MKIKLVLLSIPILGLLAYNNITLAANQTCGYDPESGKPNPLGMRAFITFTQEGKNTQVVFEQFPSNVGAKVTIASRREMVFYDQNIQQARAILLAKPAYYSELVGYEDPEGFAPVNNVITCN